MLKTLNDAPLVLIISQPSMRHSVVILLHRAPIVRIDWQQHQLRTPLIRNYTPCLMVASDLLCPAIQTAGKPTEGLRGTWLEVTPLEGPSRNVGRDCPPPLLWYSARVSRRHCAHTGLLRGLSRPRKGRNRFKELMAVVHSIIVRKTCGPCCPQSRVLKSVSQNSISTA